MKRVVKLKRETLIHIHYQPLKVLSCISKWKLNEKWRERERERERTRAAVAFTLHVKWKRRSKRPTRPLDEQANVYICVCPL